MEDLIGREFTKILPFLAEIIFIALYCAAVSGGICLFSSLFFRFSGRVSRVLRQKHVDGFLPHCLFSFRTLSLDSPPSPPRLS